MKKYDRTIHSSTILWDARPFALGRIHLELPRENDLDVSYDPFTPL